jgi:hypothetical protein
MVKLFPFCLNLRLFYIHSVIECFKVMQFRHICEALTAFHKYLSRTIHVLSRLTLELSRGTKHTIPTHFIANRTPSDSSVRDPHLKFEEFAFGPAPDLLRN